MEEARRLLYEAGLEENEGLLLQLMQDMENSEDQPELISQQRLDAVYDRIRKDISPALQAGISAGETAPVKTLVPRIFLRGRLRWAAAAAVLLLLLGVIRYADFGSAPEEKSSAAIDPPGDVMDVRPPAGDNAILKLSDGTTLELDKQTGGILASQDGVEILKQDDGLIVYKGNTRGAVEHNTLTVPRGSKPVMLVLADGTRVWLNVASSITYPTAFGNEQRLVTISGEVYFEVAPLEARVSRLRVPFIVKIDTPRGAGAQVEVLGTHFCINAYNDEKDIRVSLMEGAVRVSKGTLARQLRPGQQASIIGEGMELFDNVNMEAVLAWKNGYFSFRNTELTVLMRQISRWYNVDIRYEGAVPDMKFGGGISRNTNLSEVLKILEENNVHCRIKNNGVGDRPATIIVSP